MKALPCPLCGATPHHGLGKVEHCQLHGEPFQRWNIKCPRGHVSVWGMDKAQALREWNARPGQPTPDDLHYSHNILLRHCETMKAALNAIAERDSSEYAPEHRRLVNLAREALGLSLTVAASREGT